MIDRLGGVTLTAQVRDEAALSRAIDPVMTMANLVLERQGRPARRRRRLEFRKQEGARPEYVLDFPAGLPAAAVRDAVPADGHPGQGSARHRCLDRRGRAGRGPLRAPRPTADGSRTAHTTR